MAGDDRDTKVEQVCLVLWQSLLHEGSWTTLGFPERPKVGSFFNRFRPSWRVQLEERVSLEILGLVGAAHLKGGKIAVSEVPALVAMVVQRRAWESLGSSSQQEAEQLLASRMLAYAEADVTGWPGMLESGLDFQSIPDRVLWASLAIGVERFPGLLEPLIGRLRARYQSGEH